MKAYLAILVAAVLLFGCVNISGTAKAASFGKNQAEKDALGYFTGKYGDPTGSGEPRILETLVSTAITDFMPADKVSKYNKDVSAFHVWFFYDNFAESDAITVTFTYLDDGTAIHSFNSKGGGDFGAGSFTLQKPDDGWPTGNYEVVVSGKGVSSSARFEVIDGPTETGPLPYEEGSKQIVGNDRDEYGCIPSAGYEWCAALSKCIRPWEEDCSQGVAQAQPATTAGMTSDPLILDTSNNYLGACSLTGTSKFTLASELQVSLLQIWYNWQAGESTLQYALKKNGANFASGTMVRADCDPYQSSWCNGNYLINKAFPPGTYELTLPVAHMCLKPGDTGVVRLYGKQSQSASSAAAPQLPSGVPQHLTGCTYTGSWSTNWGGMQLVQNGNEVTGTYTHDSGKLSGLLADGVFVGKWSESPSYSEPGDGGDMVFYFTKDCNSFSGTWHYGVHQDGTAWSGTWAGTKN